ncbi:recombinase RecA [Acidicapsa dinghuensis]|uniref:Protein RecA n=1 Tax=Acidicapsa dinghuensis TaxID=2218256 RepID=A0ABW1EDJ3_9BACT|nr:recombinase RecA [Acidicapsa dinghuensis]
MGENKANISMLSAATIRFQVEAELACKIPAALSPAPRVIHPIAPTGVSEVDALLDGGLPVGAITEMVGPESSGRTAIALSLLRHLTHAGRVCAWVDVSDMLSPESVAAEGVNLARLLWVRCGVSQTQEKPAVEYKFSLPEKYLNSTTLKKGLPGDGGGGHPRNEGKGLSKAVSGLLRPEVIVRCAEPQRRMRPDREIFTLQPHANMPRPNMHTNTDKPWSRIEQALHVTDLLLQVGGFSAIVLDMASICPEHASRVPLATWFRYRAAAERTQAIFLLLTQHSCAKSSGELLLRFLPGEARNDEATVFMGIEHHLRVERMRFAQEPANVVLLNKLQQRANVTHWKSQTTWSGAR